MEAEIESLPPQKLLSKKVEDPGGCVFQLSDHTLPSKLLLDVLPHLG
jgi:hypothetical protein